MRGSSLREEKAPKKENDHEATRQASVVSHFRSVQCLEDIPKDLAAARVNLVPM